MEYLEINCTANTPDVIGNPEKGELIISGNILKSHALEVFAPINKWLNEYMEFSKNPIKIILDLEMFSTSASLCITDITIRANSWFKEGRAIDIYWYYPADDDDWFEEGEFFKDCAKFPFHMVER